MTEEATTEQDPVLLMSAYRPDAPWKLRLLFDGNVIANRTSNVLLILRNDPALAGRLQFDLLKQQAVWTTPPPWDRNGVSQVEIDGSVQLRLPYERALSDEDLTEFLGWFGSVWGRELSKTVAFDSLVAVSHDKEKDPVRDYLQSLAWDGAERLDTLLPTYFGVEDTPLNRALGRKFLLSAVARALQPGCKVDTMLILEGGQGALKSTAVEVLASSAWYTDQFPSFENKDGLMANIGVWIREFPELAGMDRGDHNRIKGFISSKVDRYRPTWGRTLCEFLRRCVFIGTTNDHAYLRDDTGNRRFWPVSVGVIDILALKRDRDQLWAEATVLFLAGSRLSDAAKIAANLHWWLMPGEHSDELSAVHAERLAVDPREDRLAEGLLGIDDTTITECLELLKIPAERQDKRLSNMCGRWLRNLGFEQRGRKGKVRLWTREKKSLGVDSIEKNDAR